MGVWWWWSFQKSTGRAGQHGASTRRRSVSESSFGGGPATRQMRAGTARVLTVCQSFENKVWTSVHPAWGREGDGEMKGSLDATLLVTCFWKGKSWSACSAQSRTIDSWPAVGAAESSSRASSGGLDAPCESRLGRPRSIFCRPPSRDVSATTRTFESSVHRFDGHAGARQRGRKAHSPAPLSSSPTRP
jgi:hypothetical protein